MLQGAESKEEPAAISALWLDYLLCSKAPPPSSPLDFSHLAVWKFSLIRQATHEQRSPLSSVLPAPEQMLSRSSCLREFLDVFYVLAKVEAGGRKA